MSAAAADGIRARPIASERRLADAVRALTIDAVTRAKSGRLRVSLRMADAASVLWRRFLKFDAADPAWPDRDRFVLSAGQASMLLYALLHLTGHAGMEMAVLQRYRQLHSAASGHPEARLHPAIEATTGPLGEGFANAVGMALAERLLAARFGRSLVDHRTWVIAHGDALMEGVSHEAAAIAGKLGLARLTVLYDESDPPAGAAAMDGDPLKRLSLLGWATKRVDAQSASEVAGALSFALRSLRPTAIACHTAGAGASNRAGFIAARAATLTSEAALAAKRAFGWTAPPFSVPEDVAIRWREAGTRGAPARRAWLRRLAHHALRDEFMRITEGRLPEQLAGSLAKLKAGFRAKKPLLSTAQASEQVLEVLAPLMTELIGGSTELARGAVKTAAKKPKGSSRRFSSRAVDYGAREHGMAGAMNGLARHGGIIPYGSTPLAFSDYMRPALRLAALMHARVIHVFTHDSIGLGADGPARQPIEQLASLRAVPNFFLLRPADPLETAECWEIALARRGGPSALVLTRQMVPACRIEARENLSARGGYIIAPAPGVRRATLIASGSEVAIALAAREALARAGIGVAVVSLPCWKLFAAQERGYRDTVLGSALRVGIEAAGGFGWERWLGANGVFVGMEGFGASGPAETLFQHFGITPEAVAQLVKQRVE